jgi:hypothetical protein
MTSLSPHHRRWNAPANEIFSVSAKVYGGHASDHLTYIGVSDKPDHTVFLSEEMMGQALNDLRERNEEFKNKLIELWKSNQTDVEFGGRFKMSCPQIFRGQPFRARKKNGGSERNFEWVYIKIKKIPPSKNVDHDIPFMIQTFYPIINE